MKDETKKYLVDGIAMWLTGVQVLEQIDTKGAQVSLFPEPVGYLEDNEFATLNLGFGANHWHQKKTA